MDDEQHRAAVGSNRSIDWPYAVIWISERFGILGMEVPPQIVVFGSMSRTRVTDRTATTPWAVVDSQPRVDVNLSVLHYDGQ